MEATADVNAEYHKLPGSVQSLFLKDMATERNLIDTAFHEVHPPIALTPRFMRHSEDNRKRTKEKAEVYTPVHIVDQMNMEVAKGWASLESCVDATCLEITCGEGVFLATPYNSGTGEPIPLPERKGLLDRKLQMLNLEEISAEEWLAYASRICKSMYGYEIQADSLIIARTNMLSTYQSFFKDKYGIQMPESAMLDLSHIIAWNLFQMDGLTQCIPQEDVAIDKKTKEHVAINGIPARIMDWKAGKDIPFTECGKEN